MRFKVFFMFLLLEGVNGAIVYYHQELLKDWQGWALLVAPVVLGVLGALLAGEGGRGGDHATGESSQEVETREASEGGVSEAETADSPAPPPASQGPDPDEAAIGLLAVLQQEGRLVDFLMEDITPYPDEQVGAAAREVHDKCRKAVEEIFGLKRVLDAEEGSRVEVDEGFDPTRIRLVGRLGGGPPFRGVLLHAGWRCTRVALPRGKGRGGVVAPAEVEV